MEGILGIIGVILGFILAEVATYFREARREKKEAEATRLMVQLEADTNIGLLSRFWEKITPVDSTKPGDANVIRCRQYIRSAFPSFRREAFTGNANSLNKTLSSQEITALLQFYAQLDSLLDLRTTMLGIAQDEAENWRLASGGRGSVSLSHDNGWTLPPTPFADRCPEFWQTISEIVEPILKVGNPLKKEEDPTTAPTLSPPAAGGSG